MAESSVVVNGRPVRVPWTLWLGLMMWGVAHALLAMDVVRRGGVMVPYGVLSAGELAEPVDAVGRAARWMAVNMTPVCWLAYLFVADGLLTWLARRRGEPAISSLRHRPNRFVVAWMTSIPVWCFFDWVNFYWMDAWRYHGLPSAFGSRALGYFLAFAAISPGMFLAAQLYQHLGLRRLRVGASAQMVAWWLTLGPAALIVLWLLGLLATAHGRLGEPTFIVASVLLLVAPAAVGLAMRQRRETVALLIGTGFLGWTFLARDPISNLTLWVGVIYLLDPINAKVGQPSLLRDWASGHLGRTAALFAGGATCGLLWEFWNYWALTKWTYHLSFLGRLEQYAYFEMPLLGFMGFLPFAAECWVMLNTILAVFARLHCRVAERLPDADGVI